MQTSGSLELQTSQLNIMNGFVRVGFFVYVVFPPLHPMAIGKTLVACLPGLLFQLTLWFFNLLSSTPPPTMFYGLFSICSFISTLWRCLSSLKYRITVPIKGFTFGDFFCLIEKVYYRYLYDWKRIASAYASKVSTFVWKAENVQRSPSASSSSSLSWMVS